MIGPTGQPFIEPLARWAEKGLGRIVSQGDALGLMNGRAFGPST
jgi:hypothetical protein